MFFFFFIFGPGIFTWFCYIYFWNFINDRSMHSLAFSKMKTLTRSLEKILHPGQKNENRQCSLAPQKVRARSPLLDFQIKMKIDNAHRLQKKFVPSLHCRISKERQRYGSTKMNWRPYSIVCLKSEQKMKFLKQPDFE